MGKFNRKIKRNVKPIPLSGVDKFIYCLAFIIIFAIACFIIVLFGGYIPDKIAFSDDRAMMSNNRVSWLTTTPFVIVTCFSLLIAVSILYDNKVPIFGNKKFKPKWSDTNLRIPPLFSKEFNQFLPHKTKAIVKRVALILSITSILSFFVLLLGLCPRNVITKDHKLVRYNSFNSVIDESGVGLGEKLTLRIARRKHFRYSLKMTIEFGNYECEFSIGHFSGMSTEQVLEEMLYLKSLYEGRFEIYANSLDWIDDLIEYNNYEGREKALIYELFDYSE